MALAKRIIPCLDVDRGRVVKGVNFVGLRDAGDPVEIARRYDEQGADELTFLDITARSEERDLILHVVEAVAAPGFLPLTLRGGTREGFDLALTRAVADAVDVPVIASGGVGELEHLAEGVLEGRADAVLAASVFHFGEFTLREAKQYMAKRGIEVRL